MFKPAAVVIFRSSSTEINERIVYTMRSLCHGYAGIEKFNTLMNILTPMTIPSPGAFKTIFSTLHKHMSPHGRIPNATIHTYPNVPIQAYPQSYVDADIMTVVTIFSSSIPDTSK